MAYENLVDEISEKLVLGGLFYTPDPRDEGLSSASRGNFDGSFLIRSVQGAQPWVEALPRPLHWRGELEIQIGTQVSSSAFEAEKTMEQRARLFFKTIVYSNLQYGRVYEFSTPQVVKIDKKILWSLVFKIRWTDNT